MHIEPKKNCRVCGKGNLTPVLSLGEQYVTNFLEDPSQEAIKGPLELILCGIEYGGCGLLQLKHTLPRDLLYTKYWYQSGISSTMVNALRDVVQSAERTVELNKGDIVIDIGSNDGTLLRQYDFPVTKVGFEPSNLWKLGIQKDTRIIHEYFNKKSFEKVFGSEKAKIITSIAMFYDLDDPNEFVRDVRSCLDKDGVWIIQMNYLGTMLKDTTFDNISHEHLEYYSLMSLENLLKRHHMGVFDIEINDVNGGSFRTFIRNKGSLLQVSPAAKERLETQKEYEVEKGLEDREVYEKFEQRVNKITKDLRDFLETESLRDKITYIFGASTRGSVVLQHTGIDNRLIKAATDKNPDKEGKYIVGTQIPIISLENYRKRSPDNLLVLPYQFKEEIISQEKDFLENGGKMIFALPKFEIIGKEDLI